MIWKLYGNYMKKFKKDVYLFIIVLLIVITMLRLMEWL